MAKLKEETVNKYHKALVKLKQVLEYHPKLSMRRFMCSESLDSTFGQILIKGGIIERKDEGYYWSTIDPSANMARELLKRRNKMRKQYADERAKKARGATPTKKPGGATTPKKKVVDFTATKYLWGLITVKTHYHYKKLRKNEHTPKAKHQKIQRDATRCTLPGYLRVKSK